MGLFRNKKLTESHDAGEQIPAAAKDDVRGEDKPDLSKLKKKDLLEILLKQGEEIDSLRKRVSELEAALEDKEIKVLKAGTMAEAALALNGVFEAADKAAMAYVEGIRRKIDGR